MAEQNAFTSVLAFAAECLLVVGAFPLAEALRLQFFRRLIADPPRWKLAWLVGTGVLVINFGWSLLGHLAGESIDRSQSLLAALAIHYIFTICVWHFMLWSWGYMRNGMRPKP